MSEPASSPGDPGGRDEPASSAGGPGGHDEPASPGVRGEPASPDAKDASTSGPGGPGGYDEPAGSYGVQDEPAGSSDGRDVSAGSPGGPAERDAPPGDPAGHDASTGFSGELGGRPARRTPISDGVAVVNGIRMHYSRAGDGPALVLLHGWPQTRYCWRKLIGELAATHTVIAPDLRGYGNTDKPRDGYDKRTMAGDISELIKSLGFSSASVIGHDRGARVAHRWGLDRPAEIERVAMLDIIPTREMWARMDTVVATGYWHWLFHLQPDLPERLAGADVAGYLGYFFERWTFDRHGLEPEVINEYVRAFSAPGALRAGFEDYRAAFPTDAEHDDADVAAGRRLPMPVLALWGPAGLLGRMPVLDIWRGYANDVRGEAIPECGHFLPEERPAAVLAHLREFLGTDAAAAEPPE